MNLQILYKYRGVLPFILFSILLSTPGHVSMDRWFYLLVAGSLALRVWCRTYIGEHSRGSKFQAPRLIREGPYSLSRNPLYIANLLMGLSMIRLSGVSLGMQMGSFLLLTLQYGLLGYGENIFLKSRFGDEYIQWSAHTPMWIGNFRFVKGIRKQSILNAFLADGSTWFFQSIMIIMMMLIKN